MLQARTRGVAAPVPEQVAALRSVAANMAAGDARAQAWAAEYQQRALTLTRQQLGSEPHPGKIADLWGCAAPCADWPAPPRGCARRASRLFRLPLLQRPPHAWQQAPACLAAAHGSMHALCSVQLRHRDRR